MTVFSAGTKVAVVSGPTSRRTAAKKRWRHAATALLLALKRNETAVLAVLFLTTFLIYFYASDLKGIWNDDAVRLTIANGGVAVTDLAARRPGTFGEVIESNGAYATQPAYLLLVNCILRLTRSYSVIPIVTTNLIIFLLSAFGIHLLARRLLPRVPRLLALLLYLGNGFAMVHVLQVREYPLILFFLVWNTIFYYRVLERTVRRGLGFWLAALAYSVSCSAMFYTTKWAPFFLWPQAIVAILAIRQRVFEACTVVACLFVASLSCLPWLLSIPTDSKVFVLWDKRPATTDLLFERLYAGTEHLLIGSAAPGHTVLQIYYWAALAILTMGLLFFGWRFFRERFETRHLVLTIFGFLAFQITFFFLREPLSTWPRYFILYLPFVVLIIPLTLSKLIPLLARSTARRGWAYTAVIVIAVSAGLAQLSNNYRFPYIDHGPDFREVYRYLVPRVAPEDLVLVGLPTNRMALSYYWGVPRQVRLGYRVNLLELTNADKNIWTISYKDQESPSFRALARQLEEHGFRLNVIKVISHVTVRQFERRIPRVKGDSR